MCDTVDSQQKAKVNIADYHGISYKELKSIDIPDGVIVEIADMDEQNNAKKMNGPLFGPFKQTNIHECYSNWNYMVITMSKEDEDGKKMVEVCSPKNNFCLQYEPGSTVAKEDSGGFLGLFKNNEYRCKPTTDSDKLNLRIPVGRQIWLGKDHAMNGPYVGPAYYPGLNVDGMDIHIDNLWLGMGNTKKRSGTEFYHGIATESDDIQKT